MLYFFYIVKLLQGQNVISGSLVNIIWSILGIDYYVGGMFPTYALVGEWFTGAIICLYLIFPLVHKLSSNTASFNITSVILYALYFVDCFIFQMPHTTNIESIVVDLFYFWIGIFLFKNSDTIKRIPMVILFIILIPILIVKNNLDIRINCLIISLLLLLILSGFKFIKLSQNKVYRFILKKHLYNILNSPFNNLLFYGKTGR